MRAGANVSRKQIFRNGFGRHDDIVLNRLMSGGKSAFSTHTRTRKKLHR